MKTTRSKLVEFLYNNRETIKPTEQSYYEETADKLISQGFVEIEEEPREFWILQQPNNQEVLAFETLNKCREKLNSFTEDYLRHSLAFQVHSVDQCKKYEKMWEELKEYLNRKGQKENTRFESFVTLSKMEQLEKGA